MPIIKSAIKRVRQTKSATARNNVVRRRLKDAQRQLDSALASDNKKDLPKLMSRLQSQLDTAVKKHLLHKNNAARTKQRYSAKVKAAGAKVSAPVKKAKKPAAKKPTSKAKK